jgi:hypothetical protein
MLSFEKEKSLHGLIIVNNNGTSSIKKKRKEYVFNIF